MLPDMAAGHAVLPYYNRAPCARDVRLHSFVSSGPSSLVGPRRFPVQRNSTPRIPSSVP